MDLNAAAAMLGVSPDTVRRWAHQGSLGSMRPSGEFHFDPDELGAWAREHGLQLVGELESPASDIPGGRPFSTALRKGGIHRDIGGTDIASALGAFLEELSAPGASQRSQLLEQLLAREALASTGLGKGVALPHPRKPSTDFFDHSFAAVGFLQSRLDWGALDGEKVGTLILLVNPDSAGHLQILSRVAFLLRHQDFDALLSERASDEKIFEALDSIEPEVL